MRLEWLKLEVDFLKWEEKKSAKDKDYLQNSGIPVFLPDLKEYNVILDFVKDKFHYLSKTSKPNFAMIKFQHSENELTSSEISWDGRHIVTGYYNG